ncbi:MAG: hypothetical protein K1W05_09320 [Desulfovibrio sp.]
MSEQLTIPASSIRGKDWTKLSLDTLENGPNPAQEPRLKKTQGNFQTRCRTPLKGNFERDSMNRLEARYAAYLEEQYRNGEIVLWRYESMKLILADRCSYLPDFFIVKADGTPEFHETKGFWRDDARIKVKMAAKLFPCFVFYGVQWDRKSGWSWECFSAKAKET